MTMYKSSLLNATQPIAIHNHVSIHYASYVVNIYVDNVLQKVLIYYLLSWSYHIVASSPDQRA